MSTPSHTDSPQPITTPEAAAQQLSALLDSKVERLETLIARAEDVINRLERVGKPAVAAGAAKVIRHEARTGTDASHQSPPGREPEPTDSLRRAIYALSDAGRSALEISRELDEHIGKVELILALRYG